MEGAAQKSLKKADFEGGSAVWVVKRRNGGQAAPWQSSPRWEGKALSRCLKVDFEYQTSQISGGIIVRASASNSQSDVAISVNYKAHSCDPPGTRIAILVSYSPDPNIGVTRTPTSETRDPPGTRIPILVSYNPDPNIGATRTRTSE